MPTRFIDLSICLENDVVSDPPFMRPRIAYKTHGETMPEASNFFPGVKAEEYRGGQGFAAIEWVELSTHNGTHLDAPWHFHPTMDGGERAITIDEVPLD
jgi:kynurenine formamidase